MAVNIENNDPCICGSGLPFIKCCKNKNHRYASMGTNYLGQQLVYDATDLDERCSKVTEYVHGLTMISRLNKDEALDKLSTLYEKVDRALEPIQRTSSCQKGCCHCCCGMVVSTCFLEYQLILKYIKDNLRINYLNEVKEKINNSNIDLMKSLIAKPYGFNEGKRKEYIYQMTRCAFLNTNNECDIYKVRPFECRAYIVNNDPADCLKKGTDVHYTGFYFDQVRSAIMRLSQSYRSTYVYDKHILTWFVDT